MDNIISVVQSVEASIVQIENITVELKLMSQAMPNVTKQVEEFTKSMTKLKKSSTDTFITMEDKFGNLITMSQRTESSDFEETNSSSSKTKEETKWEVSVVVPPPPPPPPSPPPPLPGMSIGEAITDMPKALENLRTQYDNIVKSANAFSGIVADVTDKVLIQSGAAQFLTEEVPAIGDAYNALKGPMQDVMFTVGEVGGAVGEFAENFQSGVDFAAELAGGISNAYNAVEGGLQSFSNYMTTVKEIDTMVRTLTDAQKWAAFFTEVYTVAQSALNVVMNLSPWTLVIGFILGLVAALKMVWDRSERFRQILFGLWEVAKLVFKGMFDIGKTVFDGYVAMWTGIGKLILGVFAAISDGGKMFREGLADIKNSGQLFTSIPGKFVAIGQQVGEAMEKGKLKGSESYKKSQEEKALLNVPAAPKPEALKTGGEGGLVNTKTITGNKPGAHAGSGTNNSRNITVRIESLVKEINIFSNVKEGAQDVRRLVQEELIAAVRDFEGAIT